MAVSFPDNTVYLSRTATYLDRSQSWTRALWCRNGATTPSGGTPYRTYLVDGDPAFNDAYVLVGSAPNANTALVEVFDGASTTLDSLQFTASGQTWFFVGMVYDSTAHTLKFYVNNALVDTLSVNFSAITFTLKTQRAGTATGSLGDDAIAQVREWQAALTNAQLTTESASPVAVLRTNLLTDTPIPASGYYADQGGNGRDWTLTGAISSVDDPYTPPNQSFGTAIALGTLPQTIYQRADFGGSTKTLWYTVTPAVNALGPFGFGDLVTYKPTTTFWTDASTQVFGSALNVPAQISTTAGTPIAFKVTPNAGNPSPSVLTLNVQNGPTSTVPTGSILINDSTDTYPLIALSSVTTQTVLHFYHPFPAGESNRVLTSGEVCVADDFGVNGPKLYDTALRLYSTPTMPATGYVFYGTDQTTGWWAMKAGGGATHPTAVFVAKDGTVGGTTYDLGAVAAGEGGRAITPNLANTILYFITNIANTNKPVKKFTIATTTTATFIAADANYILCPGITTILDDTVLVAYSRTGVANEVRRFDSSGTLLNTYSLGASDHPEQIFTAIDDPNSFWVWTISGVTNRFRNIRVSDGTTLTDLSSVEYIGGVYQDSQTATPTARFGTDFSCVPWIARGSTGSTSSSSSGRRGIYVPTRGDGGAEGGGQARFRDLGGSVMPATDDGGGTAVGTRAGRIIHVPVDGPVGGSSATAKGMGHGRAIYVPPNAEGNTPDGRQRIIVVPIGTEGYSHR